jgi:2-dehydropantoate 2-reductase
VSAVNGVPWWYFHGLGGPHGGRIVESVDPGGVVSPAAAAVAGDRLHRLSGGRGHRARASSSTPMATASRSASRTGRAVRARTALSEALIAAGFKAPVRPRIRDEIWVKLWGNLAFNPISALTTATLDVLIADDGQRGVARAMMLEGQRVAEALGIRFAIDVDKRIAGAAEVGAHKTSMLQDLERGRPMEIEAPPSRCTRASASP